jgi:hypothetical protein
LRNKETANTKMVSSQEIQEFEYGLEYKDEEMNLIDQVLGEERPSE